MSVLQRLTEHISHRCRQAVTLRMKGGALYIAILVSIMIGCTLSLFMMVSYHNQRQVSTFCQSAQLYLNLKSAFELAGSSYFNIAGNDTWIKNQVNDDSIRIKKMNWGAYLLISAETRNRHQSVSSSGLYGTFMSPDTGLFISENARPVGISGQVILRSTCYLPSAGVKPAYIEGQSFSGMSGIQPVIKPSGTHIPDLEPDFLSAMERQLSYSDQSMDSLTEQVEIPVNRSFKHKTLVWASAPSRLEKLDLKNNVKIRGGDLLVDSSAHLENVLIVCRSVRFKSGFKGKVHVIATDSISMDEHCEFLYPSSFTLMPDEMDGQGLKYIQFNKSCEFYGGVLAARPARAPVGASPVIVKLHRESRVSGLVYSSGYLHLEGMVNATVIAHKLLLKTPSAVYENHFLGCEVDPQKYASVMAVPLMLRPGARLVCCEKMI
jgi:hypothetical protein